VTGILKQSKEKKRQVTGMLKKQKQKQKQKNKNKNKKYYLVIDVPPF
jgi:hypothetical protein